ncbi:sensor histidine kinase [Leadbetterella sp. DM7]|uniref:sensor histidine kinase n=1 Tax=Leadbetterella sp. DM7 TaxID=3235085 RepID=UPI00349F0289
MPDIIQIIEHLEKKGKYWAITIIFWFFIFLFTYFIFSVNVLKIPYTAYFMVGVMVLTFISYYLIISTFQYNIYYGIFSIFLIFLLYQYYTYYSFSYIAGFDNAIYFITASKNIGPLQFWQIPFNSKVFYFSYTMSLFHLAPPLIIRGSYEILRKFYYSQKLKEENLKLEISYLHAQINPHFLLNTLTAIYNMVMDNPKAAKSIETLSGLLQYSLYDTGMEKVAVSKELKFLKNYIKLSRIRLNSNKKLKLTINGKPDHLTIAPLILINLVENSIKHGLHNIAGAAEAEIHINIKDHTLNLTTYNRLPQASFAKEGGIGLKNTRRRLDIYYPGKHSLNVTNENGFYRVELCIEL